MASKNIPLETHVSGESRRVLSMESARWPIDTPGGRFYAEWDSQAPVSREGQFKFFDAGDRWKSFLADCPLHYFGNRGSGTRDDGTPLNYTLVNIKDWCKNTFEIVSQLRINTDNSYHRYDVLLLINGVPCVQIELKTLGISPRRAMEQIVSSKNDPGNGYTKTLLCFLQLFYSTREKPQRLVSLLQNLRDARLRRVFSPFDSEVFIASAPPWLCVVVIGFHGRVSCAFS